MAMLFFLFIAFAIRRRQQKDRQRTGLLHVAISHAANPTFARVGENNNVIDTTPTAKPGLNSHQPTSVSGSTVTGLNPG